MIVSSIAIGKPSPTEVKLSGLTGFDKHPVDGPVEVGRLGLAGDAICNLKAHGGPEQAVYVYGSLDYAWWKAELRRALLPGTFGENMVFDAISSRDVFVGDRFAIGSVLLEVTSPRTPCATLAERMGDNGFLQRFLKANRPGFYCRVLREGMVSRGARVEYERYSGPQVAVTGLAPRPKRDDLAAADIERLLATPLNRKIRNHLTGAPARP